MRETASGILGEEAVAAVRRPIETAWGLSGAACTGEAFFRRAGRQPDLPTVRVQRSVQSGTSALS